MSNIVDIEFDMKGREVLLYINSNAISNLPELFQALIAKSSLVIKFFPVLFTQVSILPVFLTVF
jgi:hypothetical protein